MLIDGKWKIFANSFSASTVTAIFLFYFVELLHGGFIEDVGFCVAGGLLVDFFELLIGYLTLLSELGYVDELFLFSDLAEVLEELSICLNVDEHRILFIVAK